MKRIQSALFEDKMQSNGINLHCNDEISVANQANNAAIRAALIEGEESGKPQSFDSSQFKREMAARYADKIC